MYPQLKALYSDDVSDDLKYWRPPDREDICIRVKMLIGSEREDGGKTYSAVVLTRRALLRVVEPDGVIVGRGFLVVDRWSFGELKSYIVAVLGCCEDVYDTQMHKKVRTYFIEGDEAPLTRVIQ